MNREEAIKQVAENYASQMCKNCLAMLYCEDNNKKCVERREQENVYVDGAKWADEHPDLSQLWHDADDMPNNHSDIMFFVDRYTIKTDYIPACLNHCQLNKSNWSEFVKKVNMTKWVYVSDLLPKGGEE